MKTLLIVLAFAAAAPATAFAQYPSQPDHRNVCTVTRRNMDGTVLLTCRNAFTGAMWTEIQRPNGDQSGTNAQGQQWRYDAQRRTYENAQSGERCVYNANGQRLCTQ